VALSPPPTRDAVEATIDCATVNPGVAKRDAQLKSADFFDIAHYPTMKFKSKRVEKTGEWFGGRHVLNMQVGQAGKDENRPTEQAMSRASKIGTIGSGVQNADSGFG
jgi:hypothetical protein